jgi:hypothetical protein
MSRFVTVPGCPDRAGQALFGSSSRAGVTINGGLFVQLRALLSVTCPDCRGSFRVIARSTMTAFSDGYHRV